jgi:dolichol kinase
MEEQMVYAVAMGFYVMVVLFATRLPYEMMVARGVEHIRAVYYNRKIVHMMAGGVGSFSVPLLFTDYWYPLVCGILLMIFQSVAHRSGRRMYWFQTEQNQNDVKFTLMWWASITLIWALVDDPWLAIVPSLFMAFGDGVTGIVRNAVIRKRSKSAIGNVFMFIVSAPLGWFVAGMGDPSIPVWGLIAAAVATFVERYEFGPIDDNILITVFSTGVLLLGIEYGSLL